MIKTLLLSVVVYSTSAVAAQPPGFFSRICAKILTQTQVAFWPPKPSLDEVMQGYLVYGSRQFWLSQKLQRRSADEVDWLRQYHSNRAHMAVLGAELRRALAEDGLTAQQALEIQTRLENYAEFERPWKPQSAQTQSERSQDEFEEDENPYPDADIP